MFYEVDCLLFISQQIKISVILDDNDDKDVLTASKLVYSNNQNFWLLNC